MKFFFLWIIKRLCAKKSQVLVFWLRTLRLACCRWLIFLALVGGMSWGTAKFSLFSLLALSDPSTERARCSGLIADCSTEADDWRKPGWTNREAGADWVSAKSLIEADRWTAGCWATTRVLAASLAACLRLNWENSAASSSSSSVLYGPRSSWNLSMIRSWGEVDAKKRGNPNSRRWGVCPARHRKRQSTKLM